jgi:hypothetical protein
MWARVKNNISYITDGVILIAVVIIAIPILMLLILTGVMDDIG